MVHNATLVVYICFLCFCAAQVDWTIKKQLSGYGQDLELVCTGDNCCDPSVLKRWYGGSKVKLLMLRNGKPTDKAKYSTEVLKDKFILKINNVIEADLNVYYQCSYGFHVAKKLLYEHDVFKSNFNATTNITKQEIIDDDATHTTSIAAGTAAGFIIVVIIVVVVIVRCIKKKPKQSHTEGPNTAGKYNFRNIEEQLEIQPLNSEENTVDITDVATDKVLHNVQDETKLTSRGIDKPIQSPSPGTSSGYSTDEETTVTSPVPEISSISPTPATQTVSPHVTSSYITITESRLQEDGEIITKQNFDRPGFQYSVKDENQMNNAQEKKIRYQAYKTTRMRRESFTHPFDNNTENMALAGFFYSGNAQYAQCFCCDFKKQWSSVDDPFDKASHYNNCHYIEEIRKGTDHNDTDESSLKSFCVLF